MTQVDKTTFKSSTTSLFADNTTGEIGAGDLRFQMDNLADSVIFKKTNQTTNPTVNDDDNNTSGNGVFEIGDIWVNSTLETTWICVDNSTGAANWDPLTFDTSGFASIFGAPADNRIAVWRTATQIESSSDLTWDGSTLDVTGDITVSGNINGKDIVAISDTVDSLSPSAIDDIAITQTPVGGGAASGWDATGLNFSIGDGLAISQNGTTTNIRIDNNNITNDTSTRTLGPNDNNSFVTNRGATGSVIWTLPLTSALESVGPRLVTTFIKVANQSMQIIGAVGVSINGLTESGSNESLIEICPSQYFSHATVVWSGITNSYYVYSGSNVVRSGSVSDDQFAVWSNSGQTLGGYANLTYDNTDLVLENANSFDISGTAPDLIMTSTNSGTGTTNLTATDADFIIDVDPGTLIGSSRFLLNIDGSTIIQSDSTDVSIGADVDVTGSVKYDWTITDDATASYTLVLADRGTVRTMSSGSANTLTIPANASVAFPIGTMIRVIQIGAGTTSITGDTGVTLNGVSAGSGDVSAQWDEVRLYKVATDEWYATGDIGAVA